MLVAHARPPAAVGVDGPAPRAALMGGLCGVSAEAAASFASCLPSTSAATSTTDPVDVVSASAAAAEALVREALEEPGRVLVALARCVRGASRAAPLAVDASRCNRCGSRIGKGRYP